MESQHNDEASIYSNTGKSFFQNLGGLSRFDKLEPIDCSQKQSPLETSDVRLKSSNKNIQCQVIDKKTKIQKQQELTTVIATGKENLVQKKKSHKSSIHQSPLQLNSVQPIVLSKANQVKKCKGIRSKKIIEMPTLQSIPNLRQILMKPVSEQKKFKAKVFRNPTCFQNNLSLFVFDQNKESITIKKDKTVLSTKIHLYFNQISNLHREDEVSQYGQKQSDPYLGYIQGNFTGSIFNVYQGKEQQAQILCTIIYGSAEKLGAARNVQIYYRDRRFMTYIEPKFKGMNLKQIYDSDKDNVSIIKLVNVQPSFDQQLKVYYMNFDAGKQVQASTHNIIFQDNEKKKIFQFFKVDQKEYSMNVLTPLTPLVAYAFILTSFTFKLKSQ